MTCVCTRPCLTTTLSFASKAGCKGRGVSGSQGPLAPTTESVDRRLGLRSRRGL